MLRDALKSQRVRNYALWVSVLALFIPELLAMFQVAVPTGYEKLVYTLLDCLVLAGLLNDPTTTAKWFFDDKK